MKYHLILSLTAAGVLGSTAFAGTMGPIEPPKPWRFVGAISAGAL